MKSVRSLILAAALTLSVSSLAMATPSGQIWIPSTDAKGLKEVNISIDNYVRTSTKDDALANSFDAGVTVGLSPLEKFKVEAGFDYLVYENTDVSSKNPIYLNAKAAVPEDAFFNGMPAVAVGIFGVNTSEDTLSADIKYGVIAKTFPVVGRLSVGGYAGDKEVLVDENGKKDNTGFLLSWDRSMAEISDKLWVAVDYMSGKNAFGALSAGAAWSFSKNVSLLVGANFYNKTETGGKPTITTQLDINF